MTGVILAHQGGWDEILMVLGPVIVIVALLRLAKKRVDGRAITSADPTGSTSDQDARGTTPTRG